MGDKDLNELFGKGELLTGDKPLGEVTNELPIRERAEQELRKSLDAAYAGVTDDEELKATVAFAEMNIRILPWLLRKRCDMLRSGGFVRPTVVTCGLMPETLAAAFPGLFGKLCRTFNFVKLEGPMRGNIDPVFHLTR